MNRRTFIAGSVAVAAVPRTAQAQQAAAVRRVAYVLTTSPLSEMAGAEPAHPPTRELLSALRALGWVEGQNLIFERRSAEGRFERFGDIVRELVALRCDVIVTIGARMTQEALRVTSTVPIVMNDIDALASGIVENLARPGRNITGTTGPGPQFHGKKLELLKEALPTIRRVAVLESTERWESVVGQSQRAAALALGLTLLFAEARPNDYSRAFAVITRQRPDAVVVGPDPFLYANRHRVIDFATQNRLPLMGQSRAFTEAGALMTYAVNGQEYWRTVAGYVDRILKGAKPADLPIQQPKHFELVINLKTAKALGLTIPSSLLLRADEVIE
jgi:putative ABC transport system substrate-binding protein